MSTPEILSVVVGLAAGYWVISRVIGAWMPKSASAPTANETTGGAQQGGAAAGQRAELLNPEWIRANWPEILGVSPRASIEVIKSAYRLRAHQYHPDKTEGLGPELKALAERKMQELNMAYTWATRSRRG